MVVDLDYDSTSDSEPESSVVERTANLIRSWWFDLETKLKQQESATERQKRKVQ